MCEICKKEPLINKKSNAIMCDCCRDKKRKEAADKCKDRNKRKRILRKANESGVKDFIEINKSEQLLKDLNVSLKENRDPDSSEMKVGMSSIPFDSPDKNKVYSEFWTNWEERKRKEEIEKFKEIVKEKTKEEIEKEKDKLIQERKQKYFY